MLLYPKVIQIVPPLDAACAIWYCCLYDLAIANRYDDKHLNNKVTDKPKSLFKGIYNMQLPSKNTDCPSSSKPAMANRLLDWFSVVMMDSKHRRQHSKPKGLHIAGPPNNDEQKE
ncbi:hypothetical protein EAG_00771 [Camponotus floridanus]|uniref:Uncharacterized protein n=1 Tax=Camponotus floridanus TaxID=104421 RepID=E2B0N1_CAMFO|nr:hypothetical protein EAG_00771 [Camponotus floridanus]